MAGKKGRSGRPKKNKMKNEPIKPAAPPVESQKPTVLPSPGDNLNRIEQEIGNKMAEVAAQGQPAGTKTPAGEDRKPPERLIRLGWKCIYGMEDAWARASLGLDARYKGIFVDEKLIEAHVEPSAQVIAQYVPEQYWAQLDEKMPLIMLGAAIAEAQMAFFEKIQQLKMELSTNKTPQAAQPAAKDPATLYPTADQIRTA